MKKFFSWFDPLLLLGNKEEVETLFEFPLKPDETLRIDEKGVFHRLKVPSDQTALWPSIVFWVHTFFNQKSHLAAIDHVFFIFDQRLSDRPHLVHEEYENVIKQIECLKSLKNDYGMTSLGQGNPIIIDEKLKELEHRANYLYAIYLKQVEIQAEEEIRELLLYFFKESQDVLYLLSQESCFGLQEARRLSTAYCDDRPDLLSERLTHIQARLLLAYDLGQDLDVMSKKYKGKEFQGKFEHLRFKLAHEVDLLQDELKVLAEDLNSHLGRPVYELAFDKDRPVADKMMMIQDHLNLLAA